MIFAGLFLLDRIEMIPVNSGNNCSATDSPFIDFFCFVLVVSGDYCCRNLLGGTVSTCFPTNERTQAGCLSSWNPKPFGVSENQVNSTGSFQPEESYPHPIFKTIPSLFLLPLFVICMPLMQSKQAKRSETIQTNQ